MDDKEKLYTLEEVKKLPYNHMSQVGYNIQLLDMICGLNQNFINMALTGLKLKTNIDSVEQRILISTDENVNEDQEITLTVSVAHCDNEWQPKGERLQYYRTESEKDFHVALRKDAADKEHLITQMSTNPEWNPEGYTKMDEELEIKKPADAFNTILKNFKND